MSKRSRPPLIIVIGGTGSGKSTVVAEFRKLGARTVDVDQLAHRLQRPGSATWHGLLAGFCGCRLAPGVRLGRRLKPHDFIDPKGKALPELPWLLTPRGTIRRDRLGATVFARPEALKQLNRIAHPPLRRVLDELVLAHGARSSRPLVLDLAVYPERPFRSLKGAVLWVRSPSGMRARRLSERRHTSLAHAVARIRHQWPDRVLASLADVVLPNLKTLSDLRRRARSLWPRLVTIGSQG